MYVEKPVKGKEGLIHSSTGVNKQVQFGQVLDKECILCERGQVENTAPGYHTHNYTELMIYTRQQLLHVQVTQPSSEVI